MSSKVTNVADISAFVDSAPDGGFMTGRWAKEFERKLARFLGVRSASLVKSGFSASPVTVRSDITNA